MLSSKLKETYEQRLLEQNAEWERQCSEKKDALEDLQRQREELANASEREINRLKSEISALQGEVAKLASELRGKEESERSLSEELEVLRCAANSSDVNLSRLTDQTAKMRQRMEDKDREISLVKEQCDKEICEARDFYAEKGRAREEKYKEKIVSRSSSESHPRSES